MTENEAKAVRWIKNIRDDAVETLDLVYPGRKEKTETIIDVFEELEQYRAIGTIEFLADMKSNYVETLSDLRQYQKIGTVEECQQNKAIAEETSTCGKWISCSKKLPEKHIDVLVSFNDNNDLVIAWYSEVNKCWKNSSTDNVITAKVIAWQQLPEPYKEGEKN